MVRLPDTLRLFAAAPPGLEEVVAAELADLGLGGKALPGGVEFEGDAAALARVNLSLRCANRVLWRLGAFNAMHLAELRRKAGGLPWNRVLRPGEAVAVRASCRGSRIYHSGAAAERVRLGIADALGAEVIEASEPAAGQGVLVRIERNRVTVSVDTSGEHLHRRGYRHWAGKAPLRETLAAGCLRLAEWRAQEEALLDPLCGSGTLVIEAAMLAAGIAPGAARGFAFEAWPGFAAERLTAARGELEALRRVPQVALAGADRDAGAAAGAAANAARAGVEQWTEFALQAISAARPIAARGLLLCNPPYGGRIGEVRRLRDLYASLGNVFRRHFDGWRLGFVTGSPDLARATGVPVTPRGPILDNGGLKVRLYLSG